MSTLNLSDLTHDENQRFNHIAGEVRQEYNAVIEAISMPHVHNINWIVGNIASRNKATSPLYLRLCFVAFVLDELRHNTEISILVVADRQLAIFFKILFK